MHKGKAVRKAMIACVRRAAHWAGRGLPCDSTSARSAGHHPSLWTHLMCSTNAALRLAALCTICSSSPCPACCFMLALYNVWKMQSTSLQAAGEGAGKEMQAVSVPRGKQQAELQMPLCDGLRSAG